jgi:hypothetical protein
VDNITPVISMVRAREKESRKLRIATSMVEHAAAQAGM